MARRARRVEPVSRPCAAELPALGRTPDHAAMAALLRRSSRQFLPGCSVEDHQAAARAEVEAQAERVAAVIAAVLDGLGLSDGDWQRGSQIAQAELRRWSQESR